MHVRGVLFGLLSFLSFLSGTAAGIFEKKDTISFSSTALDSVTRDFAQATSTGSSLAETSMIVADSTNIVISTTTSTAPTQGATDAVQSQRTSSTTQTVLDPRPTPSNFPVCHDAVGDFRPFCQPTNGSDVWVDNTYFVTWDPDYYTINSSITMELNYANVTGASGASAYTSPRTPNSYGYVTIKMEEAWLQGNSRNNLTLFIVEIDAVPDQRASILEGPTVSLIHQPPVHYKPPPPTKVPNRLGLILGLPIGLGFFVLILGGLCIGMRKHRKIGLGSVMGSKPKGYADARSRIERLGGSRKNAGGVRLQEMHSRDASRYMDEPSGSTHGKTDSVGSLTGDFDRYNETERTRGNVFRAEVARMKSWRQ